MKFSCHPEWFLVDRDWKIGGDSELQKTWIDARGRLQYDKETIDAKSLIQGRVQVSTVEEFFEQNDQAMW